MEQTGNYGLNQWDGQDRILREDFNADNAKIDAALAKAGNCQVVTGSYVGTGTVGQQGANTLTFSKRPLLLIIMGTYTMIVPGIIDTGRTIPTACGYDTFNDFTWQGNTIRWHNGGNMVYCQLNTDGETYHYIAIYAN